LRETKNAEADELAKATVEKQLFFQTIEDSYIKTVEVEPRLINIIEGEDW
jgi:hypothetical protein